MDKLRDPVAAYDCISPHFPAIALRRKPYLDAVDTLIVERIPAGSQSLLDVGAGDGSRARKIAALAGIQELVLLEPSRGMSRGIGQAELWNVRAEDLNISDTTQRFDVITCLWNVIGHIRTRADVLHKLRGLLTPQGRLFFDVTHRYNARSYGMAKSAVRYVHDRISPREENGDVTAHWSIEGTDCSTYGHVFTDREMRRLAQAAGLQTEECIAVDYETGRSTKFKFQGNLFYVFKASYQEAASAVSLEIKSDRLQALPQSYPDYQRK
jgi:2-polyprenyl-3-methyl-5-hydroxy-6-metoxy-1,4-benzoquinol methylase